ncbi:hypothetical protein MTO96_008523 [Rhipicephalus appendiculatus]
MSRRLERLKIERSVAGKAIRLWIRSGPSPLIDWPVSGIESAARFACALVSPAAHGAAAVSGGAHNGSGRSEAARAGWPPRAAARDPLTDLAPPASSPPSVRLDCGRPVVVAQLLATERAYAPARHAPQAASLVSSRDARANGRGAATSRRMIPAVHM